MKELNDHLQILLKKDWNENERIKVLNLINTYKSYKKFMPKNVSQELLKAIKLCIDIKDELNLRILIENNQE